MREDFGEPHAAFSMLVEFKYGRCDEFGFAFGHGGDSLSFMDGLGEFFFEALVKVGLVVEEVELGRCAAHKEEDDTFGWSFWEVVAVGVP